MTAVLSPSRCPLCAAFPSIPAPLRSHVLRVALALGARGVPLAADADGRVDVQLLMLCERVSDGGGVS